MFKFPPKKTGRASLRQDEKPALQKKVAVSRQRTKERSRKSDQKRDIDWDVNWNEEAQDLKNV